MEVEHSKAIEIAEAYFGVYQELDKQFMRYGFDKNKDQISFSHEFGPCAYFTVMEKIDIFPDSDSTHIEFAIGAFLRPFNHEYEIESINAILYGNGEAKGQRSKVPLNSRKYVIQHSPLPTKAEIQFELTDLYKAGVRISKRLYPELARLGFDVRTISGLTSLTMSGLRNGEIILTDLYSDKDSLGYIFSLRRNTGTDEWNLHTIKAYVQLDSIRTIEGVIVVGKKYSSIDAPFPTKNQIRNEVLEMVKMKKIKEKLALVENNCSQCKRRNL